MGAKTVTLCLDNDMKFKGNFLTSIPANHSVTFTEPYMVNKGIGSWNIHTFASAVNDDENKREIFRALTEYKTGRPYWSAFDASNNPFDLAENICRQMQYKFDAWRIVYWSDANGTNVTKTYTSTQLFQYVKYYETGATGNAGYNKEIDRIKCAVNSCVIFGFGPEEPNKVGDGKYTEPWKYTAKLFINDINTDTVPNASDERILIPKHNNMVAMTPRKSTGREISYRPSQEKHTTQQGGDYEVGVNYATLKTVSDDNRDMVAAGVDYYYDNNTGMYHAGTVQILAILMEDLPSANIKAPDIDNASLKDESVASSKAWYNKSGQYYSGNYQTAVAMPISMENGNPNTYGPDITICEGTREIDKVRAVNRSNNKFDKGQTVMLNKINGEWIVTEFGEVTSEPAVPKIGKWGFSKYMANSDCFFRDTNGFRLHPEDAQELAIYRCWSTLPEGNTIAKYNNKGYIPINSNIGVNSVNFCTYAQCSSFDYKLTNPKNLPAHMEQVGVSYADEFPLDTFHSFWGPLFTYGYTNGSVVDLGNKTLEEQGRAENFIDITNHPIGYRDVTSLYDTTQVYQNNRLVHCPPDIATCTYAGSDLGHPVYKSEVYIDILNGKDDVSGKFAELVGQQPEFRKDQAYLWSDQGEAALIPQNNASIVWMPLGQCTALGDDINTHLLRGTAGSNIVDNRENKGSEFRYWRNDTLIRNFGEGSNIGRLHKWYDRGNYDKYNQPDLASLGQINTVYSSNRFIQNNGGTCIPYFTYLKRTALDKPMHALRIFEDTNNDAVSSDYRSGDMVGPGVVGISTARVAIGRRNGGPLNINIGGMYGRIGTLMSTNVGKIDYFAPPGSNQAGIASVSGGLPKDSGGKATWGSADDKIYSFGAFNIFAMVWDYWPSEYTIFIPEYFMVLHFNPGISGQLASYTLGPIADGFVDPETGEESSYNERIYNLDYDSDFRVPTIMDPLNGYATYAVEVGEIIDYMVEFAPSEFWHVNTQRRGICVTGGYYYPRVVVGLGDDWEIFADGEPASVSGSGFGPGDEIEIDGGAKVRVVDVDENGAIRDIAFVETTVEGTSVTYKERGSGFTPDDFPEGDDSTTPVIPQGKLIYLNSTSAGGTPATILWKSGIGYEQVVYDEGCQRRDGFTTPQRITPGSGAGNETVGEKWSEFDYATTIQLNPNPETGGVKDNYEVFFFCQNDVDLIAEQATRAGMEDWMADLTVPQPSWMTMDIS